MEKKQLRDVHVNIRDMYNRALACADDPKNRDYAITLLADVVRRVPALVVARQKLRELEMMKKPGFFAKLAASSSSKKNLPKIQEEMTRSPLRALMMCEDELAKNLNNPEVLKLMMAAGRALNADFIEIEALEVWLHYQPNDQEKSRRLADLYKDAGEVMKRAEILTALSNRNPNDYELQAEAKAAMNVINAKKEEENAKAVREKIASEKENVTLQLSDGTIHDSRQARIIINKITEELKSNNSMDLRRKLAEAYMVAKEYDNAIEQLELVAKALGTSDPALDKAIEQAYVAKFDAIIQDLTDRPEEYENAAQQVEEFKARREEFRFQRAEERLKMYPNDSQLQYDYAELCYQHGKINEAVKYFEEAVQSQRLRLPSLVYLGRCSIRYREYDKAIEFLGQAVNEMVRLDKRKLEALYYLGMAYERAEKYAEAVQQFEQIVSYNEKYRDAAEHLANCRAGL